MSHDALSHLVQRTLQPEPAVGPRLPSRYEGWRGGPDTEIGRDVDVTSPPPAAYRPSTNAEEPASGSPGAVATHEETGPAEPDRAHDDSPATTGQPSARTSQEPDHSEVGVSRAGVTVDPDRTAVLPGKPPPPAEHVRPMEPLRAGQQHTNNPIPRAAPVAPATMVIPTHPRRARGAGHHGNPRRAASPGSRVGRPHHDRAGRGARHALVGPVAPTTAATGTSRDVPRGVPRSTRARVVAMSSPLAIATVTAVLKDLLNDGLVNSDLSASVGTVTVSALPPNRVGTGNNEPSRAQPLPLPGHGKRRLAQPGLPVP